MNINIFPKWDKTKPYAKYDIVRYYENAYYALNDVPAEKEISDKYYWLLIVANGSVVNNELLQDDNIRRAIKGGSGGGIRLLPTTGQSTTDGMTQKAITDALAGAAGIRLLPTTGQSTTDGMTQKAITDALAEKADETSVSSLEAEVSAIDATLSTLSTELSTKANASDLIPLQAAIDTKANQTQVDNLETELNGKQETLISGTNIKTINGVPVLGEGNITIGGSGVNLLPTAGQSTTDGMTQKAITDALAEKATNEMVGQLQTEIESKADQTTVDILSQTVDGKADSSSITILQNQIATKANQSDLETLQTTVSEKADTSTVQALADTVADKADTSTVQDLETTVSGKADQSSLNALEVTVEGKQNQLIAGDNITITPVTGNVSVISASGGGNDFIIIKDETTYEEIVANKDKCLWFDKSDSDNQSPVPVLNCRHDELLNSIMLDVSLSASSFERWHVINTNEYALERTYNIGSDFEVGTEKWFGTYTEDGVTYQVYSKIIKIDALPAEAGITNYPHDITGIKQILQAYGFTGDGFVLNAPRQNIQDNISIYQVQKSGNIGIEVGKDRSSKNAYVCLIYAKNN